MTGGQYKGSMKQFNQYSTPRERITDEFRENLMRLGTMPFSPAFSVGDTPMDERPLAMVYAPESTFTDVYDDAEGLSRGTIFSDLYFPFEAACRAANVTSGGNVR